MKYLVVSDNHGNRQVLVELAEKYRDEVDLMLHCGDSELEPTDELWQDFKVVSGNCDFDQRFKPFQVIETAEDIIYLHHGHATSVNFTMANLQRKANEVKATIALYGHTHRLDAQMLDGLLIVNPGSIQAPRGPIQVRTYAIIESHPQTYQVNFYTQDHQLLPEYGIHFNK